MSASADKEDEDILIDIEASPFLLPRSDGDSKKNEWGGQLPPRGRQDTANQSAGEEQEAPIVLVGVQEIDPRRRRLGLVQSSSSFSTTSSSDEGLGTIHQHAPKEEEEGDEDRSSDDLRDDDEQNDGNHAAVTATTTTGAFDYHPPSSRSSPPDGGFLLLHEDSISEVREVDSRKKRNRNTPGTAVGKDTKGGRRKSHGVAHSRPVNKAAEGTGSSNKKSEGNVGIGVGRVDEDGGAILSESAYYEGSSTERKNTQS